MVVVEGTAPFTVEAASTANGDSKEDGEVVSAGSKGGCTSDTYLGASPSSTAAAATAAATPPAQKKSIGLGLVSSIKYEPLRCHASDAPTPNDPAFPDPASLPNSCARVRQSASGSLGSGSGNGIGNSSRAYLAAKGIVN